MRLPLLAVLVLPLALAGCSGDPGTASSAAGSAAPSRSPAAPAPSPSVAASPAPASTGPAAVRMTGSGMDLPAQPVAFGDPVEQVLAGVTAALGEPSKDTGTIDPFSAYGTCPGEDLRVLEYDGGALQLLFGTPTGGSAAVFNSWALTRRSSAVPQASAVLPGGAVFDFGPGTTLAELEAGAGEVLDLSEDELTGSAFRLGEQTAGFFGTLSGPDAGSTVESVQSGDGCGE